MGHYDYDRSGPSKAELRNRRRAYEKKQAKQLRDEISEEEIRTFLLEVSECDENCERVQCFHDHARDVIYGEEEFDAARVLVERGVFEDVSSALPLTDRGEQLVEMCVDEGWVTQGMGWKELTDDGHHILMDGEIDRTNDPKWEEKKARQYRKHD